jgi:hypothetical protein
MFKIIVMFTVNTIVINTKAGGDSHYVIVSI